MGVSAYNNHRVDPYILSKLGTSSLITARSVQIQHSQKIMASAKTLILIFMRYSQCLFVTHRGTQWLLD